MNGLTNSFQLWAKRMRFWSVLETPIEAKHARLNALLMKSSYCSASMYSTALRPPGLLRTLDTKPEAFAEYLAHFEDVLFVNKQTNICFHGVGGLVSGWMDGWSGVGWMDGWSDKTDLEDIHQKGRFHMLQLLGLEGAPGSLGCLVGALACRRQEECSAPEQIGQDDHLPLRPRVAVPDTCGRQGVPEG